MLQIIENSVLWGQDTIEDSLAPAGIGKSDRSIVTLHSGRLGLISHGSDRLS